MENRIKLKDDFRVQFFNQILSKNNITLKQLSKKINCGYSGLKNWRTGKFLIPEEDFNSLLALVEFESAQVKHNFTKYPSNWGAKLGGVVSNDRSQTFIAKRMAHARRFRKHKIIVPPEMNDQLWEFLGTFFGDGCLSKVFSKYDKRWLYFSILTGHMQDDLEYYKNKVMPTLKYFNCNANYNLRPEYTVVTIRINNKNVFNFLKKHGMPVGLKKDKLRIPKEVFISTNPTKAAILRGLLDTDGHIFARKDEGYKYPYVKITSASKLFRKDIKKLIRGFGLPAYEHGTDVLVRGSANFKTWMNLIGSSHPLNIKRYNNWLKTGVLLPKNGLVV